ncbi:hypothetical protein [Nevskia sp.]|uniref:hypothetical protein n=1 Tax=Nevskia sp. TaxID=1929292 RepID=UPI003F6F0F84
MTTPPAPNDPDPGLHDAALFAHVARLRAALRKRPGDLESLRDAFAGRTVLLLSCGPSLNRWREVYDALPERPVVACVKQAIDRIDVPCHLHFLNSQNLQRFRYRRSRRPLQVFSASKGSLWFADPDLLLNVGVPPGHDLRHSLAATGDFAAEALIDVDRPRRWGPGIMYETVFHTLALLGVRRIVTVGWDIADGAAANTHFYDTAAPAAKPAPPVRPRFMPARWLARNLGLTRFCKFWLHVTGRRYNPASMIEGEAQAVAAAVPSLVRWLDSLGIELQIVSDSAWQPGTSGPSAAVGSSGHSAHPAPARTAAAQPRLTTP